MRRQIAYLAGALLIIAVLVVTCRRALSPTPESGPDRDRTPTPLAVSHEEPPATPSLAAVSQSPRETPTPTILTRPQPITVTWQLPFAPAGDLEIRLVAVAGDGGDTLFVVDSSGRLLRINAVDGQVEAQAAVWSAGPRGVIQGARVAVTGDVVAAVAADSYWVAQAKLPYFRAKAAFFDAETLERLWELPAQVGRDYQMFAGHGQVAITTDGGTIALYAARSGRVIWAREDVDQQYRALAANDDVLFVRAVSLAPPAERGHYEERQAVLALSWATGEARWETRPLLTDDVSAALTDGQRLYLLTSLGQMVALDAATGQEVWRIDDGPEFVGGALAAVAEGRLYGARSSALLAAAWDAASGQVIWRTALPGIWSVSAVAMDDERLYLVELTEAGIQLEALDIRDGLPLQQTSLAEDAAAAPVTARVGERLAIGGRALNLLTPSSPSATASARQLTSVPPPVFTANMPPADEVLYESTAAGNGDIWAQAADGSRAARAIVADPAHDWDPAGSPDGRRVALESYRSGASNVWTVDRAGDDPIAVTDSTRAEDYNLHPTWSPDGQFIAFASDRVERMQIWVTPAGGGAARQLTGEGRNWDPAWSPDGNLIAFVSDRLGTPDIWMMNADGSDQRPWRASPAPEFGPAWSPGCARDLEGPTCAIAYVRAAEETDEWGELRAGLFNGSLDWSVPGTFWGNDRGPAWWPGCQRLDSGCWLVWSRRVDGEAQLILGDLDGGQVQVLGAGKDPSWLKRTEPQ
mgnify:CR=1 FL=1